MHPYLKRRAGLEPVTYPHPALEPILQRTLGGPLFQEQLLRIAMVAAGFSGGEAEELRRAFGFKRSAQRMKQIEGKLRAGMTKQGITGTAAEQIVQSIAAFALYGFPESHAASFAFVGLCERLSESAFPCRVLYGDAQQPADGVLSPGDASSMTRSGAACGSRASTCRALTGPVSWRRMARSALGLRYVTGLREESGTGD